MQVYKKILVTMDCSPVDDAIINHVCALAKQNAAQVILLHVVHSHTLDQDRSLHKCAEDSLIKRCDELKAQGIDSSILLKSGEPEDEIIKEVKTGDYDLVAMATHGHGFFGDTLFGSVSRALKHHISVPLLIIGPGH